MKARRKDERGFALLMVFVLAAAIAISLYIELPRVAFESQRVKEQLLIDRGEQYKRAIQLFVRKNKRFPASIDELESYQNVRFLRHKYKDPFTGKDEWRLIHVGPGGQLTDSLVQKPNPLGQGQNGTAQNGTGQTPNGSNPNGQQGSSGQMSMDAQPGFGSQSGANGQPAGPPDPVVGLNMAVARRPSDYSPGAASSGHPAGQPGTDPNQPPGQQQYPSPTPLYPGQPGSVPQPVPQPEAGQPATYPGQPGAPGQPGQGMASPAQPYMANPGFNPQQPNIQQSNPQQPNPQQPNTMQGNFSFNGAGGANGPTGQQNNAAMAAINQQIFSPRPQGQGFSMNANMGGTMSGGIAGVATTFRGPAIKVVNERKKYQEWEFVYDMKKDKSVMGNTAAGQSQNMPGQAQNPGQSSFGGTSSFGGGSTGAGATGGGFGAGSSSGFGGSGTAPTTPAPAQQP